VLDCIIQRLTAIESQLNIKVKLTVEVGIDYSKTEIELKHLQQDQFALIELFFDRVKE
jgi:hypothetical protein